VDHIQGPKCNKPYSFVFWAITLREVFETDVSGQPIGTIFEGEDTLRRVIIQKTEESSYTAAEVYGLA
jgi:hypothetical protein